MDENSIAWSKPGPSNTEVTMAMVFQIEARAKARISLAEIAREVRLPYWRVEQILKDGRIAYKP